jgi:ADP-ribose pyrophosphatase YjhB (NUDIX family)
LSTPIRLDIGIRASRDEIEIRGRPRSGVGCSGDTAAMPSWYRDPDAPTPNRPMRIGAVALIERNGELLLERRADDDTWGLPGGALEAVSREVREETGLSTRALDLYGVFSDPSRIVGYADGNVYRVLAIVFRVDVEHGTPVASEESVELRFVPHAELLDLNLTPAHRPIVESFLAEPPHVVVE